MSDETTTLQAPERVETKLDMARVARWAELLEGDHEARQFMRQRLAGGELSQLSELSLRSRRLELALQHGIPAQLAEVHLTADDPQLLAQQAESLAQLLQNKSDDPVGRTFRSANLGGSEDPPHYSKMGSLPVSPLPAYEAAPVGRDEWLEQQFVRLYEH